jgi:hypothetical protein
LRGNLERIFVKYAQSHAEKGRLVEKHSIKLDNSEEISEACEQPGCTKIIISYAKSINLGSYIHNVGTNKSLEPFGLGWQNHRYLCHAKLSEK